MMKKLLIVEDDLVTQTLLRLMFQRIEPRLHIQCAATAEDAYKQLNEADHFGLPFDIVVSDLGLPGSSGLCLWDIARDRYPHLEFVFVSGMPIADWDRKTEQLPECPPLFRKPLAESNLRAFWREHFMGIGVASS